MIASYTETVAGIKLRPFKFMGHGWMYIYNGNNPGERKKLIEDNSTFEIPDVPKKKNSTPSSVLLRSGSSTAENKPTRKVRSCCGGRK